ncbi:MAG TPA: hypothetical protein VMG30_21635 [Acidobacteriota bacterium]|nr:hypothetical protein [Acidobacteriota bacterium]
MKSKLGVILLGILVFLLGGIAGAVSHYLYCEQVKAKPSAPKTIPRVEDVVDGMAKILKLDERQKAEVNVIITETRDSYLGLWQQFKPQYQKIVQNSDDRIRAILRDDQKPLFEEYLKKIKSKQANAAKPASAK